MKDIVYDSQTNQIKGAFINLCVTVMMAILMIVGCFVASVAKNIETMATFMLGFWGLSFGFWKGGNILEGYTMERAKRNRPWDGNDRRSQVCKPTEQQGD